MININDPQPANEVIGTVLVFGEDAYGQIQHLLTKDDFSNHQHQDIWESFKLLSMDKIPISANTVMDVIKNKIVDYPYLAGLMSGYPNPNKIMEHALIVKKQGMARHGINHYRERIQQLQNGEDPEEVFSRGVLEDSELLDKCSNQDHVKFIGDGILDFIEDIAKKKTENQTIIGLRTGFEQVDYVLGGLDPDTINIIAARPGTYKTTFSLNIAKNVAQKYGPVYFTSLEMSRAPQLQGKILAQEAELDSMAFRNLNLLKFEDIDRLATKIAPKINDYGIIIDDSTETKASQMLFRLRRAKKRHGIKLVIIDYLQLIDPEKELNGNRRAELNTSLRIIKKTTRELYIPLILICQMNREVEKRKDKKPILSDLNETGNIEQDASSVLFLYRDPKDPKDIITGSIAKNRYGPTNHEIKFIVDPKKSSFKINEPPRVKVS